MRYAILNDLKVEAKPEYKEQRCICPLCNETVIPVCGEKNVHHWRHKVDTNCELEHSPMTAWHKTWQNQFDISCREVVHHDELTKEKHVADIKTQNGLIIELQHSTISTDERISRENFYKNMIWIIDGKKYFEKFQKRKLQRTNQNLFICLNPSECLPAEWLNCSVPVYFDFLGIDAHQNENYNIFVLLKQNNKIFINQILINSFIQLIKNATLIIHNNSLVIPPKINNYRKNIIRRRTPYLY